MYPLYTTLFLNADDNSAKLKGVRFSINGSPKEAYQEALLLDKPGNYYVIVEAEDNLGNISTKKMIFIVKAGWCINVGQKIWCIILSFEND